ncbi:MAG: LptF/LptG family permease [Phycisphaerae bacterium]
MNTIDRYVARTFLMSYVLLLLAGMGLYVVGDLLVNIDDFTADGAVPAPQALRSMADYYLYNVPLYFSQLGGFALAIAACFTLALMHRNNEMTALVAAGMPLQRLLVPILACAVVLAGAWLANREFVLPEIAHKIARQRSDVQGARTLGVYCIRDDKNNILTALRLYPREGVLARAFVIEPDESGAPARLIEADEAIYDPAARTWRLERGRRVEMGAAPTEGLGAPIRYEPVAEFPLRLTPEDLVLRQGAEWSELLSLKQMNALVEHGSLANRPTIVMARHVRLTTPLLQLILLVLTATVFVSRAPANVLARGGRALLIGGVFFAIAFMAQSIVREEHAELVAWSPILIFGPWAAAQWASVKT